MSILIDKVVEIDKMADDKVKQAKSKREEELEKTQEKIKAMKVMIKEKSEEKLKEFEKTLETDNKKILSDIEFERIKNQLKMKEVYDKNKQIWTEDLFKQLLEL